MATLILTDEDLRLYIAALKRYRELFDDDKEMRKTLTRHVVHLGAKLHRSERLKKGTVD